MAHRLRNEIGGAALHGLHHLERRGSARQHHDGQVFIPATDFPQRFQTVLARHHDIQQYQRDLAPVPLQASQHFFSVLRRLDRVAVAPQSHLQIAPDFQFIFT